MEIKIDPEFRDIIPALTNAEFEQLEKNLVNEGCRERIITWNDYIIDGHNRYNICSEQNIDFEIREMNDFEDRHAVIDWMIHNQIGKRNLTAGTISYLRGLKLKREKLRKMEEIAAEKEEEIQAPVIEVETFDETDEVSLEDEARANAPAPEEVPVAKNSELLTLIKVHEAEIAQEVADMYQISASTLKKDEKFTDAIDTIRENLGRDVQDKILNKQYKLNPAEVVNISKLEVEEQKEFLSGADDEIHERLAEVKREKNLLNQEKALLKLDLRIAELNGLDMEGEFVLESDEEHVYLLHKTEEAENLIHNFKGTGKVDTFLDGFVAAVSHLSALK